MVKWSILFSYVRDGFLAFCNENNILLSLDVFIFDGCGLRGPDVCVNVTKRIEIKSVVSVNILPAGVGRMSLILHNQDLYFLVEALHVCTG